jgi:hypothetical protein
LSEVSETNTSDACPALPLLVQSSTDSTGSGNSDDKLKDRPIYVIVACVIAAALIIIGVVVVRKRANAEQEFDIGNQMTICL